jgi:hypothetical protein
LHILPGWVGRVRPLSPAFSRAFTLQTGVPAFQREGGLLGRLKERTP